jgi:hypothetical protein
VAFQQRHPDRPNEPNPRVVRELETESDYVRDDDPEWFQVLVVEDA